MSLPVAVILAVLVASAIVTWKQPILMWMWGTYPNSEERLIEQTYVCIAHLHAIVTRLCEKNSAGATAIALIMCAHLSLGKSFEHNGITRERARELSRDLAVLRVAPHRFRDVTRYARKAKGIAAVRYLKHLERNYRRIQRLLRLEYSSGPKIPDASLVDVVDEASRLAGDEIVRLYGKMRDMAPVAAAFALYVRPVVVLALSHGELSQEQVDYWMTREAKKNLLA